MNKNIQAGIVVMVTFLSSHFFKMDNTKAIALSAIIGFTFYIIFEIVGWRNTLEKRLEKIEQDINNIQKTNDSNYEILSNQFQNSNSNSHQSIEVMK